MVRISICKDFSETPGGRYIKEGRFSGEEFREQLLKDKYMEAEDNNTQLEIDFDGCYGIGTSFLEEAFGGLVRKYHIHGLLDKIVMISTEDETIPDNVYKYVTDAEKEDLQ